MKKLWYRLGALLLLTACQPSVHPIEYGKDKCDFCRMTIVDAQHAAEAVTDKGKVYKFDAIECMVQFREREKNMDFALLMVNDYLESGVLVDAQTSTFLISPNMPSPMGANLSAFVDWETAQEWQAEKGGELYNWTDLVKELGR